MPTLTSRVPRIVGRTVDRLVESVAPLVPTDSMVRPVLTRVRNSLPSSRPVDPIVRLVSEFALLAPQACFVQVGANDGSKGDYLQTYIRDGGWTGLLVEPIPYVFAQLTERHGSNPRLTLVNAAIAEQDGAAELYYLPKDEGAGLPPWYDALATFRRDVLLKHEPWIPDVASRIRTIEVPTLTFESLCNTHGVEHIDLVQMDTEGYDYEIIKQINLDRYKPTLILYEHLHLEPSDRHACARYLFDRGYRSISTYMDTLAIRVDESDWRSQRLTALASKLEDARGRSSAPGVTVKGRLRSLVNRGLGRAGLQLVRAPASGSRPEFIPDVRDATFDHRFHSGENSLPPGAEEYLRADNPRLIELRDSYSRLDWPVCTHSRWRDETVRGWLNLKYFRGDNIIIWHYREGPENNKLFYFTYLIYILDQGGAALLEQLGEDGAFGCWVYDFPGYPTCSRDLLDSVNELMFLDKHLSILAKPKARILDIGAGYGRLAYRAGQALADLADYCCVDAIAESTFLSEYYTRVRQVAPPARVVPLPEVPSLREGSFDLAVNVHSFSECRLEAVEWWMGQVDRLQVPYLFIVPNESSGFSTTEVDGSHRDYLPTIEAKGYRLVAEAPTIQDVAVRHALGIEDRFCLFERKADVDGG